MPVAEVEFATYPKDSTRQLIACRSLYIVRKSEKCVHNCFKNTCNSLSNFIVCIDLHERSKFNYIITSLLLKLDNEFKVKKSGLHYHLAGLITSRSGAPGNV